MQAKPSRIVQLTASALVIVGGPVLAQPPVLSENEPPVFALEALPAAPAQGDSPAVIERPRQLDLAELAEKRAKATIIINDQDLDAVTSGNEIGDYIAGEISLSDNALSSFNGVGNFIFNTGAQNNLQAGMTLTINIDD